MLPVAVNTVMFTRMAVVQKFFLDAETMTSESMLRVFIEIGERGTVEAHALQVHDGNAALFSYIAGHGCQPGFGAGFELHWIVTS